MGYHHLLLSPPPSLFSFRGPRGGGTGRAPNAVSASASAVAARAPAVSAEVSTRRRAVLLVGVSALPLLRLRDAAARAADAPPSVVDLVTDRTDVSEAERTQPEEPEEKLLKLDVAGPPSRNPLVGILNAIAIVASGIFAGLLGTSQQEKKALQRTISSMETKLVENEAAMSMLRESYEKMLLDEQAELKKQTRKFQEEEASLLDQLALSRRTATSLTEEVQKEKELVEQLNLEIDELERGMAQAEEDKHLFEGKLKEKMEMIDILHDKVNLLSQEVNAKEQYSRELSSSLSSKEDDYQNLNMIYHQTKENLEQVSSQIKQLEKDALTDKDELISKIALIDSLNEEVQKLYTEKDETDRKLSELMREYSDLKTATEERASRDYDLLLQKDTQLNQLQEKLSTALSDSSKDRCTIEELKNELDTTKAMLLTEAVAQKDLSDLVQSTEETLRDSRNEVFKLSEELNEVKRSNQDLITQISKFTNESTQLKQALADKTAEAESVSATLSDELASVRVVLERSQEELEATSKQLLSVTEAHGDLKKELLDAYKKLESLTNELVEERTVNATLNREVEALVKQSELESEERRVLEADLDGATRSLNEVNESTQSLSKQLEDTNSRISAIEKEKEVLSKDLEEQKKCTVEAQENMKDAQNTIEKLGTEREFFEMRSRMLEDELATAKGMILLLRRQISASESQNAGDILDTGAAPNVNQPLNGQHVNDRVGSINSADAGARRSSKRIYRRRKHR